MTANIVFYRQQQKVYEGKVHASGQARSEGPPPFYIDLSCDLKTYRTILKHQYFNLRSELSQDPSTTRFRSGAPILITLTLSPLSAEKFEEPFDTQEAFANFLRDMGETDPDAECLQEGNWLALRISQQQKSGETTYRTLWDFCDWKAAAKGEDIGQVLFNGFSDFAQSSGLDQELSQVLGDELLSAEFLQSLFGTTEAGEKNTAATQDPLEKAIGQILEDAVGNAFDFTGSTPGPAAESPFNQLVRFLVDEGWGFSRISGQEALNIDFQGSHLRWMCYARYLPESRYLLFYSYYPFSIPKEQLPFAVEFITQANFNMVNGNFEIDMDQGQIRYKTSLWVEKMSASQEAFRQLIFTNVNIADDYFPGIQKMLEKQIAPATVLEEIEG